MSSNPLKIEKRTNLNYALIEEKYTAKGYRKIPSHLLSFPMKAVVPELIGTAAVSAQFSFYFVNDKKDIDLLDELDIPFVWLHKTDLTPEISSYMVMKELENAKIFYSKSFSITKKALDEVRTKGTVPISDMTSIVDDITASVAKHPSALLCMRGLQNSDEYTYHHSVNVSLLACIFAKFLGYSPKEVREIGLAGLLHDIGKQRIPLEILNAPRKLSNEEFEIMKSHPRLAEDLLKSHPDISENIMRAVTAHHEKFDGSGYPHKFKKDEIHPYAVILSLADVYDALTSERAYKKAFPQNKTAAMIYSQKGTAFKADMAELFICCFGIYPIGTLVKLNETQYAIVYENNKEDLLHPKVLEITKKDGKYALASICIMDLRKYKNKYKITTCENAKGENINLKELLENVHA